MTKRKKPAHTYKVGDRVRLVRPVLLGSKHGMEGTVVIVPLHYGPHYPVIVDWEGGLSRPMQLSEIEPA